MRKQILGAVVACLIGVPALAGEDTSIAPNTPSQSKLGSFLGSMREKINKSKVERAERAANRPPLFSRSRAALSGAAAKMGLQGRSGRPLARLTQGNPVKPWKSSIPIQKFW